MTGEGTYARYRVTGNVLVWKDGDVVMRLETTLDRAAAIRIAESVPAYRIERGGNLVRYGGVEGSNTSVSTRGAPR